MRNALEQFMIHLLVDASKAESSGLLVDGLLYALSGLGLLGFAWWLHWGGGHGPEAGLAEKLITAVVALIGVAVLLAGAWLLLRAAGIGLG